MVFIQMQINLWFTKYILGASMLYLGVQGCSPYNVSRSDRYLLGLDEYVGDDFIF